MRDCVLASARFSQKINFKDKRNSLLSEIAPGLSSSDVAKDAQTDRAHHRRNSENKSSIFLRKSPINKFAHCGRFVRRRSVRIKRSRIIPDVATGGRFIDRP